MKITSLPETGFVRLPSVLAVFPISKSSLYAGIQKGIYPAPIKLSERTSAWKVEDSPPTLCVYDGLSVVSGSNHLCT